MRAGRDTPLPGAADHRQSILIGAVLMVIAIAIRSPVFANPLIHVDENFYLLVGDRMLQGALPYVDIWDRKPIGIFLLYAAIRLMGGTGVIEHSLVAALAAGGTAIVIAQIARRMAGPVAATLGGVSYLLMLGLAGGLGGQTPVFYNLPVSGAALIIVRMLDGNPAEKDRLRSGGAWAMLLIGLAIQLKYTVVFEGFFFGVLLLIMNWRARRDWRALALNAVLWIFIASAPTLLAYAYYAARGQSQAFLYANFLSILGRSSEPMSELLPRLMTTGRALVLPLICVAGAAILKPWQMFPKGRLTFCFSAAWLGAALFGYFLFGTFFNHYALPLMAPIAVCMAPLFSEKRRHAGLIAAAIVLLMGTGFYIRAILKTQAGGAAEMRAELAAIEPRLTGCLYVYDGDSALYLLSHSCLPTRYPFSSHLMYRREAGAIGIEPLGEIRRIMATRPSVIVDTYGEEGDESPVANALVRNELKRSYHLVLRVAHKWGDTLIYQRNPGQ